MAGQFNAFIFNDYTATGGEVAGTMAVGRKSTSPPSAWTPPKRTTRACP
ncbi:collagen-binding domain-containing protein [Undibacterium pigrum]